MWVGVWYAGGISLQSFRQRPAAEQRRILFMTHQEQTDGNETKFMMCDVSLYVFTKYHEELAEIER